MKYVKKFLALICSVVVILSVVLIPVSAQNYAANVKVLNCDVDLLISLDDGSTIVSKNADKPVAPASLTKIMTALVVLRNKPNLEETVTVTEEAIRSLQGTGSSIAGLKAGETMSLYHMLCCMLIPSGNDAAVALAYAVGGSEENFVKMMNDTATEIGCKNTHFDNPHGLDSDTHKTTANDLAIITKEALQYPTFETIVSNASYKLPATNMQGERTLTNTNFLLNPAYVTYYYKYCKGIKTGSTDNAGKCLVSMASKDGYNYLAVAMGGDYRDSDKDGIEENQAFMDSLRMYKWAFSNLSYEAVSKENQYVVSVPVKYCWSFDSVRLVAMEEVLALVPTGNGSQSVSFVPQEMPEALEAPFKKGDYVCTAKIMYAEQEIGTVKLAVAEDAHFSLLLYIKDSVKRMAATTIFKIVILVIVILILLYIGLFVLTNYRRRKKRELKIVRYNELERNTVRRKKNTRK